MSLSWTRRILTYALLIMPAMVLGGLLTLVAVGTWISAILHDPTRFAAAPVIVQKLTRAVNFETQSIWQTLEECVEFDAKTFYRPRPGACHFSNAEFSTVMHFDERGVRLTEKPAEMLDSESGTKPRIVVLGDSHAMGWGAEDHETFASRLVLEYGYDTINLGVSSYGTARELLRLEQILQLESDDIVVIQYNDNDLGENEHFVSNGSLGPYHIDALLDVLAFRPVSTQPLPVAGTVLRISWQLVISRIDDRAKNLLDVRDHTDSDERAVRALVGVIQSFPILRNHRVLVVAVNWKNNSTHLEAGRDDLESAGLRLIVPLLSSEHFMPIDGHMTPLGHRVVAAAIADAIRTVPVAPATSDSARMKVKPVT